MDDNLSNPENWDSDRVPSEMDTNIIKTGDDNDFIEEPTPLKRHSTMVMDDFLIKEKLDSQTIELLLKYDKDGNGIFSKHEVVSIISDLRKEMENNQLLTESKNMFKKVLLLLVVFCILLAASMFGLSYAVAAMTRNTVVLSDGTLVSSDDKHVTIATDSHAIIHILPQNDDEDQTQDDGNDTPAAVSGRPTFSCLSNEEALAMRDEIQGGRDVFIQYSIYDNDNTIVTAAVDTSNTGTVARSTATVMGVLSANGAYFKETKFCFSIRPGATGSISSSNHDGSGVVAGDMINNQGEDLMLCLVRDDDDSQCAGQQQAQEATPRASDCGAPAATRGPRSAGRPAP